MPTEVEASFESQVQVWTSILGDIDTQVLCCAVDLGIPEILHAASKPLSLSAIAAHISPSPPSDLYPLHRIMRFLTRKGFFRKTPDAGGEVLYHLTPLSKLLIKTSKPTVAPMVMLQVTTKFDSSPGSFPSECVRTAGNTFSLARGKDLWTKLSTDPEFNAVFNEGMVCWTESTLEAAMESYAEGFAGLRSITDVGGGNGTGLREIIARFPNIQGVNFDLPHVVAGAPEYPGVRHVAGDMFVDDIPPADAVFMKSLLHCFHEEDCVKILKNCRKVIPEKGGKVILVEMILSDDPGTVDDLRVAQDILMLMISGGIERTEEEWSKVLKLAGFPRYKIIRIPAFHSIIEAYIS